MFIPELLSYYAGHTPEAAALVADDRTYSYATLHNCACCVAHLVDAAMSGNDPHAPVVVCLPKSALAVAALYGVMISGHSYIPLDPSTPEERIAHIVDASGASCVISAANDQLIQQLAAKLGVRCIPLQGEIFSCSPVEYKAGRFSSEQRAAILFTSGSTGAPKGAVITHGNLQSFVEWALAEFSIVCNDRLGSHAPLQFDLSFFDLFAALRAGAAVCLIPPDIAGNGQLLLRFIRERGITVWQSVPSAIGLLVDAANDGSASAAPQLRAVLFAGERMPVARLQRSMQIFSSARHYNVYGCTESNDTFMYEIPRDATPPDPLPIGKALPYVDIKVLDEEGIEVPQDSPGTLWVAAPTLMAGYLNADETARVIQELIGADGKQRRYYCTRDLVQRGADGNFHFLGRTDSIIKTSGFRVNLQEVEDKLTDHELIEEAGVIAVPDDQLGNKLLAVVKPIGGQTLNTLIMKQYCGKRLPRYMIPHQFWFTAEPLPKNRNGKVDKKILQQHYANS